MHSNLPNADATRQEMLVERRFLRAESTSTPGTLWMGLSSGELYIQYEDHSQGITDISIIRIDVTEPRPSMPSVYYHAIINGFDPDTGDKFTRSNQFGDSPLPARVWIEERVYDFPNLKPRFVEMDSEIHFTDFDDGGNNSLPAFV